LVCPAIGASVSGVSITTSPICIGCNWI